MSGEADFTETLTDVIIWGVLDEPDKPFDHIHNSIARLTDGTMTAKKIKRETGMSWQRFVEHIKIFKQVRWTGDFRPMFKNTTSVQHRVQAAIQRREPQEAPDTKTKAKVMQVALLPGTPQINARAWFKLLTPELADAVRLAAAETGGNSSIIELTHQVGQPPMLKLRNPDGGTINRVIRSWIATTNDIDRMAGAVSASLGMTAAEANNTLFVSGNRCGPNGTLHRVSIIRAFSAFHHITRIAGFTARMGKTIPGISRQVLDKEDLTRSIEERKSILIVGPPCSGKTTMLRDLCSRASQSAKVVVVDSSLEIGGFGLVPHASIGQVVRLHVPKKLAQAEVMLEAVKNHSPDVLIIDEIGGAAEVRTARDIARRGVTMIATVHASHLSQVVDSPELVNLVGGRSSIPISDRLAQQIDEQNVLENKMKTFRKEPPVFHTAIELGKGTATTYHDVVDAVDDILKC